MLKKVYFEGEILVDDDESTWFDYIREQISSLPEILDISSVPIKSIKEIPREWMDSVPYGREDFKTCKEIFEQEIFPKVGEDDPNQHKFEFFEGTKKLPSK